MLALAVFTAFSQTAFSETPKERYNKEVYDAEMEFADTVVEAKVQLDKALENLDDEQE